MPERTCSMDECESPHLAKGLCRKHYLRKWKHGSPDVNKNPRLGWPANVILRLRFLPPDALSTGCIEFTGPRDPRGYGIVVSRSEGERRVQPHVALYELLVGPVPGGLELDHLCRNPPCCNPAHLEPVTHAENMRRAGLAVTHCKHGHEYAEANTYLDKRGRRSCRECNRLRAQARRRPSEAELREAV